MAAEGQEPEKGGYRGITWVAGCQDSQGWPVLRVTYETFADGEIRATERRQIGHLADKAAAASAASALRQSWHFHRNAMFGSFETFLAVEESFFKPAEAAALPDHRSQRLIAGLPL
jgi:hypothetical protein